MIGFLAEFEEVYREESRRQVRTETDRDVQLDRQVGVRRWGPRVRVDEGKYLDGKGVVLKISIVNRIVVDIRWIGTL